MRLAVGRSAPDTPSSAEAMELANRLAYATSAALGEALEAVIVHGSLTLGDYVPSFSDVDLLAVTDRPLTDEHVAALAEAVNQVERRVPVRVDFRSITRANAAAPVEVLEMDAYLKIGAGPGPVVRIEGRRVKEPDLIVELSVCRADGQSIVGPPPAELIGAVPDEWVVRAGDAQLTDWQAIGDDPKYAQLTVLTACRYWHFAEEGRHCSKDAAAEWALRQDPSLDVVRDALAQRHEDASQPIGGAAVQELLSRVRGHVARQTQR